MHTRKSSGDFGFLSSWQPERFAKGAPNDVAVAIVIGQGFLAEKKTFPMILCSSRKESIRRTSVHLVFTTLPFKGQHVARICFLQTSGAFSAALQLTNLGPYTKPPPDILRLHPFPNPFPIPSTDITLHWDQPDHDDPLTESDTVEAFFKCKARADTHLRFNGDGPIGGLVPNYLLSAYGSVVVDFASQVPGVIISSEVVEILRTLSWKMSREGSRACVVRALRTGPLGELLGKVSVSKTICDDSIALRYCERTEFYLGLLISGRAWTTHDDVVGDGDILVE